MPSAATAGPCGDAHLDVLARPRLRVSPEPSEESARLFGGLGGPLRIVETVSVSRRIVAAEGFLWMTHSRHKLTLVYNKLWGSTPVRGDAAGSERRRRDNTRLQIVTGDLKPSKTAGSSP